MTLGVEQMQHDGKKKISPKRVRKYKAKPVSERSRIVKEIVEMFGCSFIADQLKIRPQAVNKWRKRIPERHVLAVSQITGIPADKIRNS